MSVGGVLRHFDQRGQQLVHAAHQNHAAGAVAEALVVRQYHVAEVGLHPMGRTHERVGQLGQLAIVECGKAGQKLGVALGIAADDQPVNCAQPDSERVEASTEASTPTAA